MGSGARTWHTCLLFAGGILVMPPLLSLLQAPGDFAWLLSPIHATVLGGMLGLIGSAVLSFRGWSLHCWKHAAPVAYGLLTTGMLVFALGSFGIIEESALAVVAGFAVGVGKSLAFLLWAHLFSRLTLSNLLTHSAAAGLVAGVAAWLLMGMAVAWVAVVAVALPMVVGGAYAYGSRALGGEGVSALSGHWRLPWRPIIIMALVGFVAALGPVATFGISVTLEAVAFLPVGGCTLAALLLSRSFRSDFLLKASFGVYGAGFLLLLVQSSWALLAGFLVSMSYWGLSLFVFWLLCNSVRERGASPEWVFGISFALLDAMLLVGYMLPGAGIAVPSANEGGALGVFAVAALALAIAAAALWAAEHAGGGHWAHQVVAKHPNGESGDSGDGDGGSSDGLASRCRSIARSRGLTLREEEILLLLLERHTVDQIAHQLFVSGNTVKTHVKHIYGKLDVHNRDELRDAVFGS